MKTSQTEMTPLSPRPVMNFGQHFQWFMSRLQYMWDSLKGLFEDKEAGPLTTLVVKMPHEYFQNSQRLGLFFPVCSLFRAMMAMFFQLATLTRGHAQREKPATFGGVPVSDTRPKRFRVEVVTVDQLQPETTYTLQLRRGFDAEVSRWVWVRCVFWVWV